MIYVERHLSDILLCAIHGCGEKDSSAAVAVVVVDIVIKG